MPIKLDGMKALDVLSGILISNAIGRGVGVVVVVCGCDAVVEVVDDDDDDDAAGFIVDDSVKRIAFKGCVKPFTNDAFERCDCSDCDVQFL